MHLRHLGWVIIIAYCLAGCHSTQKLEQKNKAEKLQISPAGVSDVFLEDKEVGTTPNSKRPAPCIPQVLPPRLVDLIHTRLELRPDWEKSWLYGKASLTFTPWFYPLDSFSIDAKGFLIELVALLQAPYSIYTPLAYTYDGKQLKVKLDRTYQRGDTFSIFIQYIARPNELEQEYTEAISASKGVYFVNPHYEVPNKPRQIWTQGQPNAASCWFPTLDYPYERSTQELLLTVDKDYVTLSNGVLVSSQDNGDGTRTDHWKLDIPHAPYLFMFAAGTFSVTKEYWQGKEISYYVEPEYAPYVHLIFGNTPEMLDFFSQKLGVVFPWPKYAQIVVRDFVSGAMENTTAVVHMEALQHDARAHLDETYEDYIAHELFHHWFGDYVTCRDWNHLTLNESFASYAEYLWKEYKYGREEAELHLAKDLDMYLSEFNFKKVPLIRACYHTPDEMFDAHSYQKGARVLHMLRVILGEEAFFESLKRYLKKNALSDVELHELRAAFEEVSGQDLRWFFDQWYMYPGHPIIDVSYEYDTEKRQLRIQLAQKQNTDISPVYQLPVNIKYWAEEGAKIISLNFRSLDTVLIIPLAHPPYNVIFDPERYLLAKINEKKSWQAWLHQLKNEQHYKLYEAALVKLKDYLDITEVENAVIEATRSPFWAKRKIAIETLEYSKNRKSPHLTSLIFTLATQDKSAKVRLAALDYISAIAEPTQQPNELTLLLETALGDSSYSVVASALQTLYYVNPQKGLEWAHKLKDLKSAEVNYVVAQIFLIEEDSTAHLYTELTYYKLTAAYQKLELLQLMALKFSTDSIYSPYWKLLKYMAVKDNDALVRLSTARVLAEYKNLAEVKSFLNSLLEKEKNSHLKSIYKTLF
ncbi:MAG: M1 family metallopeptidase [Bacteroidia bacterium]|nr:M1 family metallopeptidase [Bacteroidia bacterium]MDW8157289.1 M1 family metallopeptidase [Bacteroidia bacterium]